MSEEILLSVTPARVVVDPGGVAQVVLQAQNRTAVVDEYVVDVLGEAATWTTLDCAQIPVFPDAVGSVQVSIQPPRATSPAAGTIPVGFRVRSTVNPALSSVEECKVEVKPFVEIGGEIAPKTARGRFSATHNLRVINKGNAPVSVAVRAEVQQGDCQVGVPPGELVVDRGQGTTAKIKVRPSNSRWQGAEEMHSYRLKLEPQGGQPVAIDAMMRQRPILGVPVAVLLAVALLLVGAYGVYGKSPNNPVRTALRWTGLIDVQPSPAPTPTALGSGSSGQQTPAAPSPTRATPSPPAQASPSAPATPVLHIGPIPPGLFCTYLSTVTLSDSQSPGSTSGTTLHTLTWKSNATCGTITGTLTTSSRNNLCGIFGGCTTTKTTTPVSGPSGTLPLQVSNLVSVSYSLFLTDGNGHTATSITVT